MKTLFAFVIATIYGLLLRFFFAFYNNITEVISISMVVLAPVAIGYLTVALIGLKNIRRAAPRRFLFPGSPAWYCCLSPLPLRWKAPFAGS
jgi:hypothetical protein